MSAHNAIERHTGKHPLDPDPYLVGDRRPPSGIRYFVRVGSARGNLLVEIDAGTGANSRTSSEINRSGGCPMSLSQR
jgi:hypothetical protein